MPTLPPPPLNDKPGSFSWLEWYRQLRNYVATSGSVPWYIINFAGSKITDIADRSHNSLQGVQGGAAGEYNHLTNSQYTRVTIPQYGEMYFTNSAYTVTVSAANTAYEVDGGFTQGELGGSVTFPDDHYLQVGVAGVYQINWSLSIDTATASNEIEGGFMINGTASNKGTSHTHVSVVSLGTTVAASAIVQLAVNDQISLFVRNHTAATNIVAEHASCTIVRIA